jgi:hypothetical protein
MDVTVNQSTTPFNSRKYCGMVTGLSVIKFSIEQMSSTTKRMKTHQHPQDLITNSEGLTSYHKNGNDYERNDFYR